MNFYGNEMSVENAFECKYAPVRSQAFKAACDRYSPLGTRKSKIFRLANTISGKFGYKLIPTEEFEHMSIRRSIVWESQYTDFLQQERRCLEQEVKRLANENRILCRTNQANIQKWNKSVDKQREKTKREKQKNKEETGKMAIRWEMEWGRLERKIEYSNDIRRIVQKENDKFRREIAELKKRNHALTISMPKTVVIHIQIQKYRNLPNRTRSVDMANIGALFSKYNSILIQNNKKEVSLNDIVELAQRAKKQLANEWVNGLIFIIGAHGDEHHIIDSHSTPMKISDITGLFRKTFVMTNDVYNVEEVKPRFFFIETGAVRGQAMPSLANQKYHDDDDFYVIQSSNEMYGTCGDAVNGSFFIQSLGASFAELEKRTIVSVNDFGIFMRRRLKEISNSRQTMAVIRDTLSKRVLLSSI